MNRNASLMTGQGRFVLVSRKTASTGWFVYSFPVVFLVGVIGNILAVIVLRRKAMKTSCSSIYLLVLAVADTAVLCLSGFKTWLKLATGFELLHTSDCSCRLILYGFYSATHVSAWLIVLVTAERLIVVHWPLKAGHTWLVRRPGLTASILVFVILAINTNILYTAELAYYIIPPRASSAFLNFSTSGRLEKHFNSNFNSTFERRNITLKSLFCSAKKNSLITNINLFIYSLLPSVLLFSFNVAIIRATKLVTSLFSTHVHTIHDKMCSSDLKTVDGANRKLHLVETNDQAVIESPQNRQVYIGNATGRSTPVKPLLSSRHCLPAVQGNLNMNFRKHVTINRRGAMKECSQQRLTLTLLTLSFCWLFLSFPYSLIDSEVRLFNLETQGRLVCFFLMYINHAVNFYLYCFLRQKFRVELKRCFLSCLQSSKRRTCPCCISTPIGNSLNKKKILKRNQKSLGLEVVMDAGEVPVVKVIELDGKTSRRGHLPADRNFNDFEFFECQRGDANNCINNNNNHNKNSNNSSGSGNNFTNKDSVNNINKNNMSINIDEVFVSGSKRNSKCHRRESEDERYN